MQSLRDILRSDLSKSLRALTPTDRLAAAWPVVAGHAVAERSTVVRLQGAQAVVEVRDAAWLPELRGNTPRLVAELASVSGVTLTDILFHGSEPGPSARGAAPTRNPATAAVPQHTSSKSRPAPGWPRQRQPNPKKTRSTGNYDNENTENAR